MQNRINIKWNFIFLIKGRLMLNNNKNIWQNLMLKL